MCVSGVIPGLSLWCVSDGDVRVGVTEPLCPLGLLLLLTLTFIYLLFLTCWVSPIFATTADSQAPAMLCSFAEASRSLCDIIREDWGNCSLSILSSDPMS